MLTIGATRLSKGQGATAVHKRETHDNQILTTYLEFWYGLYVSDVLLRCITTRVLALITREADFAAIFSTTISYTIGDLEVEYRYTHTNWATYLGSQAR